MKKKVNKISVRNMRELNLMKQKLKYQARLYEKEMTGSVADVVDDMTDKLRDLAFEVGSRLIIRLIRPKHKEDTAKE